MELPNKWLQPISEVSLTTLWAPESRCLQVRKQPTGEQPLVLPLDSRVLWGAHPGCPAWPLHSVAWAVGWAGR